MQCQKTLNIYNELSGLDFSSITILNILTIASSVIPLNERNDSDIEQ